MSQIVTDRLLLIACPLELAKSIILDRKKLEERSPLVLPIEWPSTQLKNILPYYIELLEKTPEDKSLQIWLIIDVQNRKVIGSAKLRMQTSTAHTVDLGYEIIPSYQKQGFGYEAVQALVDWVFANKNMKRITAECDHGNVGSIRILEKLGMCCIGKDSPFLKWELNREVI